MFHFDYLTENTCSKVISMDPDYKSPLEEDEDE